MSISHRMYLILAIMIVLISAELGAVWFTVHTLSAGRAYVGGEGLWSKAEKDAVYHLERYGRTRDPREYQRYLSFLRVPLGDRIARLEMIKAHPDYQREVQGFEQGRNDPADVPGMIKLFERFNQVSYIHDAIADWTNGDAILSQIQTLGDHLHREVRSRASSAVIGRTLGAIEAANGRLTTVEDHFSASLSDGARWLSGVVLTLLFAAALTVEISGLLLTASVTRRLARKLTDMVSAADRIAKGDFSTHLDDSSRDELGRLSGAFNGMTREIERAQRRADTAMRLTQAALREAQRVARVGSWEWDVEADAVAWSKELLRLYELARDYYESPYEDFLAYVHPADRKRFAEMIENARSRREPFSMDYRIVLPSAQERWLCVQGTVEEERPLGTTRVLGSVLDITERKQHEGRLEYLAQHDALTGLPNRILFMDRLRQAIGLAQRARTHGAVLFVDLDRFKDVNDSFGHAAGDRLLVEAAGRLTKGLRDVDTVTRAGGDEFLILMNGLAGADAAAVVGRAVLGAFAAPFSVEGRDISMSLSIGVAIFPRDGNDPEALISIADKAMYAAKKLGRNRIQMSGERQIQTAM